MGRREWWIWRMNGWPEIVDAKGNPLSARGAWQTYITLYKIPQTTTPHSSHTNPITRSLPTRKFDKRPLFYSPWHKTPLRRSGHRAPKMSFPPGSPVEVQCFAKALSVADEVTMGRGALPRSWLEGQALWGRQGLQG